MKYLLSILIALCLAGCGTMALTPLDVSSHVDPMSIKNSAQFHKDVRECTSLANNQIKKMANKGLIKSLGGAVFGAALGAGLGATLGHGIAGNTAAAGAMTGAAASGISAGKSVKQRERTIVHNCLIHRGYKLLY